MYGDMMIWSCNLQDLTLNLAESLSMMPFISVWSMVQIVTATRVRSFCTVWSLKAASPTVVR